MVMSSGTWAFFLSHILIHFACLTVAQQPQFIAHLCNFDLQGPEGNYTSNSTYASNLDTLLSSLSDTTNIPNGFYNFSLGQQPDAVNAIGLCRGDVELDSCHTCLTDSHVNLRELCPNQKEAIGWNDNCMFRYTNRSIFRTMETLPNAYAYNLRNTSSVNQFNQAVRTLLDRLRPVAAGAGGGSLLKFATGNITGPNMTTIYGLVQCTPDLSVSQCNDCLNKGVAVLPQCCSGKLGGRVLFPSCNFRYEIGRFYNETAPPDLAPGPATGSPPAFVPLPATAPPPPGNGGIDTRKTGLFSVSTITAAMTAILVL